MGCKLSSLRTATTECTNTQKGVSPITVFSSRTDLNHVNNTPASLSTRFTPHSPLSVLSGSKKSSNGIGNGTSLGHLSSSYEEEMANPTTAISDNGSSLPGARASPLHDSSTDHSKPVEQWVPLKTDGAQAAKEYQTLVQAKEEEKLAKAARLQMEIIDPIRPMDSFNVSHRAVLGRCWDRRAAERLPIKVVHSLLVASKRAARNASAAQAHRSSKSFIAEGGRKGLQKRTSHTRIRKKNPPRRSHWFATCGISTVHPTSAFLRAAPHPSHAFGTHSLRLLNRVEMLNLDAHMLMRTDSKLAMFNDLKDCVARLSETNTLTDIDLVLFSHTPSELAKLPNEIREKFYHLIAGFMPYCKGIKDTFAFRLSDMVDETDEDTLFLRKRNLRPAYGVQVVRWNRVEVVNPNLNTLAHAVALIQGKDWVSLTPEILDNESQPSSARGRHDKQDSKRSIDLASLGKHFIAEEVKGSFATQTSRAQEAFYESRSAVRASGRHPTITKVYGGSANKTLKRFPEEFVLSLMVETLEESYYNIKHLAPSRAPTRTINHNERGDRKTVSSTLQDPLPQGPTSHGKKVNTPINCTHGSVDNKACDEGLTLAQNRFISVIVASFQAFINPFEWKERHFTRYPIDFNINKHSARSEYGEGFITDIMYGGILFIECSPAEAAEEFQRVLQDMDWGEARSTEGTLNDVRSLFSARHTTCKGYPHNTQGHNDGISRKDTKCQEKNPRLTEHFRYRITRRIGGIPMRDSVEMKRISIFFGDNEVLEQTISTPNPAKKGAQTDASINGTTSTKPPSNPHGHSNAYSLIASAWMDMDTISAVVQMWGLHLLCNPECAQPLSFFLQKFSGIAPALLQKILPIDHKKHDGISSKGSASLVSSDSYSVLSDKVDRTNNSIVEGSPRTMSHRVAHCNHYMINTHFSKSSFCATPLTNTPAHSNRSLLSSLIESKHHEANSVPDPTASPGPARRGDTIRKVGGMAGQGRRRSLLDRRSRAVKKIAPRGATSALRHSSSKAKKRRNSNIYNINTNKYAINKSNTNSVLPSDKKLSPKRGATAALTKNAGSKPSRRIGRRFFMVTVDSTDRGPHSPADTQRAESALSISTSTVQTSLTHGAPIDTSLVFFGELELEERWNMAVLELKAQKNELADLMNSVKAAEETHSTLLEDLSVLQRTILPRTAYEDLDLALLYLETAIFEPDELPGQCLCLNHIDWFPRLAAVLTSPENAIPHVQVVTPLTPRDFPKLGMLAGLLYYPSASASLRCFEFDATNLFGSEAAVITAALERNRREASSVPVDGEHRNDPAHPSASPSRSWKGCGNEKSPNVGMKSSYPSSFGWDDNVFQATECGFAAENNHGFGATCPMFYVSPEQALDTLWLLLCAIAENLASPPPPAAPLMAPEQNPGHSFRICFHHAARPEITARFLSPGKDDSRHPHQSLFQKVSAFFDRDKSSPLKPPKTKHELDEDAAHDLESGRPFHLLLESPLLEPFVSTSVSRDSNSLPHQPAPAKGGKEGKGGVKETREDARQGLNREPCSPVVLTVSSTAGTSQNTSFSFFYLVVDCENDALGGRRCDEKEQPPGRDSNLGSGSIPIHQHFPRRPTWMQRNGRALELPFFTLPYHDESPTAPSPPNPFSPNLAARRAEPYVNPYNHHHNCARFYLTVERRRQLQRLLERARGRCAGAEPANGNPSTNGESPARFFGLADAKEEEAVLQEQEIQLAGQAEDIWQALRKIVHSYNCQLANSDSPKWIYPNSSFVKKEHTRGDPSAMAKLRSDKQMALCTITLER